MRGTAYQAEVGVQARDTVEATWQAGTIEAGVGGCWAAGHAGLCIGNIG